MNKEIQLIINDLNLSLYNKHKKILNLIVNFIHNLSNKFVCGIVENTFTEEIYIELSHPKYNKIEILNNNLILYPNDIYINKDTILISNLTVTIPLSNFNWQIYLDKLLCN